MNARAAISPRQRRPEPDGTPSPRQVFELRCWARAHLYAIGELELHEAVDALQAAAVANGLVRDVGQDAAPY